MRALTILGSGLAWMLPGLLIMVVPMVLYELGIISSDTSQIGFIGMPLAVLGLIIGLVVGASKTTSGPGPSPQD